MTTYTCPHCGATGELPANYCEQCGKPLASGEQAAASEDHATPTITPFRMSKLVQLVQSLVKQIVETCKGAEEIRYVARLLQGTVDLWYRSGK